MKKLPIGNEFIIHSSSDLGLAIKLCRKEQQLNQTHLAGIANTGNRFIVELEQGKPTVQLQKVIEVLDLLGLDLIVRPR